MAIPKGVSEEKFAVLLKMIAALLEPEKQAYMYDHGYMYPGPAIPGVPLSMGPQESQDTINRYGRPEYASLIADNPVEPPLDNKQLIQIFEKWDREIGSKK